MEHQTHVADNNTTTPHVLVTAASRHGGTQEIAEAIGDTLTAYGIAVDTVHIRTVTDITPYDAFIIGSAVYSGSWLKEANSFLKKYSAILRARPTWLFSSGTLGTPPRPDAQQAVNTSQLIALSGARDYKLFGGKLTKAKLSVTERVVTRIVHAPEGDFRDWGDIHDWTVHIATELSRYAHETLNTPSRDRTR